MASQNYEYTSAAARSCSGWQWKPSTSTRMTSALAPRELADLAAHAQHGGRLGAGHLQRHRALEPGGVVGDLLLRERRDAHALQDVERVVRAAPSVQ